MSLAILQFRDELIIDGWHIDKCVHHPEAITLYKRFPTKTQCKANSAKGLLVAIHIYNKIPTKKLEIELDLHGEIENGIWIKITGYAIDTKESAIAHIPKMINAWEALAKTPQTKKRAKNKACSNYVEDQAVCGNVRQPKGQCLNCGYKSFEH
jgi:hypothetical protein